MFVTIGFYIIMGLFGVFGLSLIVVSIASLIHNARRDHRIKKYTKDQQVTKNTDKQYTQENIKYVANNGCPVAITQTDRNNNNVHVAIGYLPYDQSLRVSQTVQGNAGYRGEKPKRWIKNSNKVLSKYSRNNGHEVKRGMRIPKSTINNDNKCSKYNKYYNKDISHKK